MYRFTMINSIFKLLGVLWKWIVDIANVFCLAVCVV